MKEFLKRNPLFFAAVCLSLCLALARAAGISDRIPMEDLARQEHLLGKSVYLGGVIVSEVQERPGDFGVTHRSFVMDAKKLWAGSTQGAVPIKGRVQVYGRKDDALLSYGDEIVIKGESTAPRGRRNPGGFDQRAYLRLRGIHSIFLQERKVALKVLRSGQGNPFMARAIAARTTIASELDAYFEARESAYLKALFIGERSNLTNDLTDTFMKTGTVHILSVSGFNIGFLAVILSWLLSLLSVPRNVRNIGVLAAIWLYCLLVGWQAPVLRASVMATILVAGELLGRKPKLVNSLGLAALVILLADPNQLYDVGFQLSFLAVFGIAVFLPLFWKTPSLLPNEKRSLSEKCSLYFKELFWVSFVCSIATVPVSVQTFYGVSPVSLLANLIVVPLTFVIFIIGALFLVAVIIPFKLLVLLPITTKLLLSLMLKGLALLEDLPGSYVITGILQSWLWCLLVLGMAWLLATKRVTSGLVRALCIVLLMANIFLVQGLFHYFGRDLIMTILDVGQGDAIYIEFPGGGNLLMDAGKGGVRDQGRYTVSPFLKSKGVRGIDLVVFSHPQADHVGGMRAVFDAFMIGAVLESRAPYPSWLYRNLEKTVSRERCKRLTAAAGDKIIGFHGEEMRVLNPSGDKTFHKNVNEDSIVLKIIHGKHQFLLTGDIEKDAMRQMLSSKADLKSDVLKVPHHGAKLTPIGEAWLEQVAPSISVISVGEHNPFHHPSGQTMALLRAVPGNRIFRTDEEGAVEVISDGIGLSVK